MQSPSALGDMFSLVGGVRKASLNIGVIFVLLVERFDADEDRERSGPVSQFTGLCPAEVH